MRIRKKLRGDLETIERFVTVLGSGSVELSNGNKLARPAFFISAHDFVRECIENDFFKKEEALIKVLDANGFPADDGPIGAIRSEHKKSVEAGILMLKAAQHWQDGDEIARSEVIWATSEFTSSVRRHLERLKNLVFPLLEQTIPPDDEHAISDEMESLVAGIADTDKYLKMIEALEEQLSDWQ